MIQHSCLLYNTHRLRYIPSLIKTVYRKKKVDIITASAGLITTTLKPLVYKDVLWEEFGY